MKLTKNFNSEEFDCNDGTKVPEKYLYNLKELARNLQVLRDHIKEPIYVNSGYRSPSYNKKVKGVVNSQHLKAKASDITTKNLTPRQLARTIEILIRKRLMKEGGVGIYKGFVHYDCNGIKRRW